MRRARALGRAVAPVAAALLLGGPTLVLSASAASAASAPRVPATNASVSMPIAETLSTTAVNTSSIAVPVPAGVVPNAITAVLNQPAVVAGGSVLLSVNGAPALTVPSTLYQKVQIPVTSANVIADGTIGLTMTTQAAPVAGQPCTPQDGTATLRKIALSYTGTETAPTTVADFFGPSASRVDVVIPADASDAMVEAGLTAVDALAQRYDDATPVNLTTTPPSATTATASQRVVALVAGRAGEVTTTVSTTGGIPMLTLTGIGQPLVDAARSLSSDALIMAGGDDSQNPSTEMKSRSAARTRDLSGLGVSALTLTGYGTTTQQFKVSQDDFGSPVSELKMHLVGSHTAFADNAGARVDIRANDALVGSTVLGSSSPLGLDVTIPAGRLRAVNTIAVSLSALSPSGVACTPPSAPEAEVDVDTKDSTITATRGIGDAEGFQLYPQAFQGTLPVAIASTGQQRLQSAIDAAGIVVALQRAAAASFDIQLSTVDAFLADDRSGLMVGALAQDSVDLDAPLRLSSTRQLDRADTRFAVTSQAPYAALESIDRHDRFVLMLGSWAPGGVAAPGSLSRKVVDAVTTNGWPSLSGDLVITDDATPAFTAASRSLRPHTTTTADKSYARWFVVAIAVLLVLLAAQVVISIRRDRRVARARREAEVQERRSGPAYVEEDPSADDLGDLGDLDDLDVTTPGGKPEVTATPPAKAAPAKTPPAKTPPAKTPESRTSGATSTPRTKKSAPATSKSAARPTGSRGSDASTRAPIEKTAASQDADATTADEEPGETKPGPGRWRRR